jgi:C4-dicarboxylate-specific signal transduction histidine kinase
VLIDQAQTVRAMNPAAARLLGCEDPACRGRSWRQFFRLERRLAREWRHNPIVACLEDGRDHPLDNGTVLAWRNQRMPVRGDVFSLETRRGHCALLCLQTDAENPLQPSTWQQEQEFLLQHMSRLNTVSELATGIAHEMNQPLSAIMSFGQAALRLLAEDTPDIDRTAEALAGTISQTRRASDILERLRAFVSRHELRMAPVAINQVIINALTLLSNTLAEAGIRVSLHTEPCPPVRADSLQLEQVMVNLVRNAVEAMQDAAPGARTLEIVSHPHAGSVHVSVTDSGTGLAPDTLTGLFTRFFTTKSEGMGLGLSICRSIVEAAGGEISAQNAAGGGACFRIRLPVYPTEGASDGHGAA